MPYVLIKTWFPPHKAEEVAGVYTEELKNYPPDRSLGKSLATAIRSDENGLVSIEIFEAKEGKLEDSLNHYQNVQIMYHKIEGFKYEIDVWRTPVEAMALLGMKLPE
ncbi:MAG: hypothetical protein ACFE94_05595 [Candidatus Hodarchaeota archaeon]